MLRSQEVRMVAHTQSCWSAHNKHVMWSSSLCLVWATANTSRPPALPIYNVSIYSVIPVPLAIINNLWELPRPWALNAKITRAPLPVNRLNAKIARASLLTCSPLVASVTRLNAKITRVLILLFAPVDRLNVKITRSVDVRTHSEPLIRT
jgi:hypothetical protein